MSTHTFTERGLAHDAGRKLKESIESSREKMERTVDALSEKLDPRRLVDGISDWAGHASVEDALESARKSARQVACHVRNHPVPYTLAGAGMAWLAVELVRKHGENSPPEWRRRSIAAKEAAVEGLHQAGESASRAAAEGRAALAAGAGEARRTLARKYERVSEACQDAYQTAKDRVSARAETMADVAVSNPIAVGGGLLALGLLAGFLLPRSRPDDYPADDRDIGSD
jgi:hypothetical protein